MSCPHLGDLLGCHVHAHTQLEALLSVGRLLKVTGAGAAAAASAICFICAASALILLRSSYNRPAASAAFLSFSCDPVMWQQ